MEILKQVSNDLLTNMSDEERIAIKRQGLIGSLYPASYHRIMERLESAENAVGEIKERVESLNPYRDQVIDEIADHIQKMTVFGKDTVDSFAIYIRSLK